ncbi:DUF4331 domain-containing protein [Chitinophaga costaii]|nr:DUF4331 domain-containing protein [Chitinophaga costaii]
MHKKRKTTILVSVVAAMILGGATVWASDHGDAPAISGKTTDLTDLYVFQSPENNNNLVFVGNVQGLLSPEASKTAAFDEKTLLEFKIDTDNDNKENLVIQCVPKNGKMYVYGPVQPATVGTASSTINSEASAIVDITPYASSTPIVTTTSKGIKIFAGPRDDPFFFDLPQYLKVVSNQATSFNNPGTDALAGTNVLSVVVELPKSLLGNGSSINVWLETKQKS